MWWCVGFLYQQGVEKRKWSRLCVGAESSYHTTKPSHRTQRSQYDEHHDICPTGIARMFGTRVSLVCYERCTCIRGWQSFSQCVMLSLSVSQAHVLEKVHLYSNYEEIDKLFDVAFEDANTARCMHEQFLTCLMQSTFQVRCLLMTVACLLMTVRVSRTREAGRTALMCGCCGEPKCACTLCKFKLSGRSGNARTVKHSCWLQGKTGPLKMREGDRQVRTCCTHSLCTRSCSLSI